MKDKRLARFVMYDKMFRRAGQYYDSNRILKELDSSLKVKKRQIYKDISFLEQQYSIKWDIELRRNHFYRYDDVSFSIFPKQKELNEKDIAGLGELLHLSSKYSGVQELAFLNETIIRLENLVPYKKKNKKQLIEFFDVNDNIIDSERNQKTLKELSDHITNSQNIIIDYKKYEGLKTDIVSFKISPHFLKQTVSQRWYLIGKVPLSNKKLDVFSVSRIKEIKVDTKNSDFIYPIINYQEYFKDRIGISNTETKNKKKEKVKLLISENYFNLFDSKPPHHSYKRIFNKEININGKKYIEVVLELKPNLEFESILLSYGENVLVQSPEWLKQKMVRRVTSLLSKYK